MCWLNGFNIWKIVSNSVAVGLLGWSYPAGILPALVTLTNCSMYNHNLLSGLSCVEPLENKYYMKFDKIKKIIIIRDHSGRKLSLFDNLSISKQKGKQSNLMVPQIDFPLLVVFLKLSPHY